MKEFVIMLVQGVMDALEEFFNSLTAPSAKFTFRAFLFSICFLVLSIVMKFIGYPCFVDWQEALTCVLLMGVIVLIDSSVRTNISQGMQSIKQLSSILTYTGEEPDNIEITNNQEETENMNIETEVEENGTGQ